MESGARPLPSESLETRVAWYAACLSVILAGAASMPTTGARVAAFTAGAVLSAPLAAIYLRRATPFSAVVATVLAAFIATATVVRLSGLALSDGLSCSQAGGAGKPSAWLLTSSSWCLAVGLLATGRLVIREGYRAGSVGERARRAASLLPVLAFLGFLVVGACQVGADRSLAVTHNVAAVAAMGSFWLGMIGTAWLSGISRALRLYSALAAVVVFSAWLPTGLRFLGLIERSPIATLHMELLAFALSFLWLGWLAREWDPLRRDAARA
jgi:hypothetical protein